MSECEIVRKIEGESVSECEIVRKIEGESEERERKITYNEIHS